MLKSIWNFFLQVTCLFCMEPGAYVCAKCRGQIFEAYGPPILASEPGAACERVNICYRYNQGVEYVIHNAKHLGFYEIADFCGRMLAEEVMISELADVLTLPIVTIPISSAKLRSRGFNQVDLMLDGFRETLRREVGVSVKTCDQLLLRTQATKTQVGQNREQRRNNLSGAFMVNPAYKKLPREVLILDDIYTTGSTITECAATLKAAGVERVHALIFAKG